MSFAERNPVKSIKMNTVKTRKRSERTTLIFFRKVCCILGELDTVDIKPGEIHCPDFCLIGKPNMLDMLRFQSEKFCCSGIRGDDIL